MVNCIHTEGRGEEGEKGREERGEGRGGERGTGGRRIGTGRGEIRRMKFEKG